MNIALGGNLHQDLRPLRQHTPNRNTIFRVKEVVFEPASQLRKIVGRSPLRVNSLHNQAINEIAQPFKLAASDRDGFVQAIEHSQHEFMIGVQWHPEYLPYVRHQRKLFAAFARAVKRSNKTMNAESAER
jgi:putative glutamine amidotransferase